MRYFVTAMMDKDRQESSKKKRKALLRLVDPRCETKALCTSVVGISKSRATKDATTVVVMPLLASPSVAVAMPPSASKVSPDEATREVKVGTTCRVVHDLFVQDYLLEGVSEFDAHTRLAGGCIALNFLFLLAKRLNAGLGPS